MVNEAVKRALAEDAEDLNDYRKRRGEKSLVFEDVVKGLRRRGKL